MLLGEINLRIAESTSGGDSGFVAGGSKPPQKTGFGSTLERGMNSQAAAGLQITTESPSGKEQWHGCGFAGVDSGSTGPDQ